MAKIRTSHFGSWQVLSCPADWVNRYRQEMRRRHLLFVEELYDGQVEFLSPGDEDPHGWKFASI